MTLPHHFISCAELWWRKMEDAHDSEKKEMIFIPNLFPKCTSTQAISISLHFRLPPSVAVLPKERKSFDLFEWNFSLWRNDLECGAHFIIIESLQLPVSIIRAHFSLSCSHIFHLFLKTCMRVCVSCARTSLHRAQMPDMYASKQIHFQTLKFSLYFVPFFLLLLLCLLFFSFMLLVALVPLPLCGFGCAAHDYIVGCRTPIRCWLPSGWTKARECVALIIIIARKESTRCARALASSRNNRNKSHKEKQKQKCLRVASLSLAVREYVARWGEARSGGHWA